MPAFSNSLPPEGKNHGYAIKRTPQSGTLGGIITCPHLLVCDTHFWGGRTVPCERIVDDHGRLLDDSPCPACRAKQGYRTHVYVSAFNTKTHDHFLFECTAAAAKPLDDYRNAAGSLRGCLFCSHRPKSTANGKVIVSTGPADLRRLTLPQPPDIPRALAVIWRIPQTAIDTATTYARSDMDTGPYATGHPAAVIDSNRMVLQNEQPNNIMTAEELERRRKEFIDGLTQNAKTNGEKVPA